MNPDWLTPLDVAVPQSAYMESLLVFLSPRRPRLPPYTPSTERVSVPWLSLSPLSLVHLLMFSPFLAPAIMWHMMHKKSYTMGMTQQVALFLDWLRSATIEPKQGIFALTSVDLFNSNLAQRQGIRTSLFPPLPHSAAPETSYSAAEALPTASVDPISSSHKAGGDARRAVGNESE